MPLLYRTCINTLSDTLQQYFIKPKKEYNSYIYVLYKLINKLQNSLTPKLYVLIDRRKKGFKTNVYSCTRRTYFKVANPMCNFKANKDKIMQKVQLFGI